MGFTRVDALRYNDCILISEVPSWLNVLSGMAEHIVDILKANIDRKEFIFKQQESMGLRGFIGIFGKTLTVLFRLDLRSIIKIKIQEIMELKTLYACHTKNMQNNTHLTIKEKNGKLNTLPRLEILQSRGIQAPKELKSTERLEHLRIKDSFLKKKNASNASAYSILASSETQTYFAPILVNRHGEEIRERTMNQGYVQNAGKVSSSINITKLKLALGYVLSVEDYGTAGKVYDLTVESNHEFFCNGILVSNCIDAARYRTTFNKPKVAFVI